MARVLFITANPKPVKESVSLTVAQEFLKAYKAAKPDDEVIQLDLYRSNIPIIDADVFSGWGKLAQGKQFDDLIPEEQSKVGRISELTDQFVNADKYVFVSPMWNLSIPPRLKTYIDCICIAGKTFKYTAQGAVGLMKGKKAVHIQARGGFYSEGPAKEMEFGDRYLRGLLGFLGIGPIETVVAEGQDYVPDQRQEIIAKASEKAKQVAQEFAQ
ncbi:MAG: FMN-dependent NADH-azoreductase [Bacillota bacterium]